MPDDVLDFARDLFARLGDALGALRLGVTCAVQGAPEDLVPRRIYNAALRELQMAEAMVRRMVLLIAVRLDITPVDPPEATRPAQRRAPSGPKTRPLPLFDPWGSGGVDFSQIAQTQDKTAGRPADWLTRRQDRLDAVIADPAPMAARMARWMRRRAIRFAADITARSRPEHCWICRVGLPPGVLAHDRGHSASLLRGLDMRAREAYPP